MEFEYNDRDYEYGTIICSCGNEIEYTDCYEPGFIDLETTEFECVKCGKKHSVEIKGMVQDVVGGK